MSFRPCCKFGAGLPDFSWNNIPNWEKYTKHPQIPPNGHKTYRLIPFQGPQKYTQN
jgi:hypothetical protein